MILACNNDVACIRRSQLCADGYASHADGTVCMQHCGIRTHSCALTELPCDVTTCTYQAIEHVRTLAGHALVARDRARDVGHERHKLELRRICYNDSVSVNVHLINALTRDRAHEAATMMDTSDLNSERGT
jgi:hypothetical protein